MIAPQAAEDYHTAVPAGLDLDAVFRLEQTRIIGNDWVVSYQGRLLQLRRHGRQNAPARSKVTVCESPDGRIEIRYRGQAMEWDEIAERPASAKPASKPCARHRQSKAPSLDHPFKQKSYQEMLARKALEALQKGEKQ